MAEKVVRTVSARRTDLERRRRAIEHGPKVPVPVRRLEPRGPGGRITPPDEPRRPEGRPGRRAGGAAGGTAPPPVRAIRGVGPAFGDRLGEAGARSARDVAAMSAADVAAVLGIGEARAAKILEAAQELLEA